MWLRAALGKPWQGSPEMTAAGPRARATFRRLRLRLGCRLAALWRDVAHPLVPRPLAARGRRSGRRMRVASVLLPAIGLLLAGGWSWLDVTMQLRGALVRDMTLLRAQTLRTLDVQESVLAAVDLATETLSWPEIRASRSVHSLLVRLADAADAVDTLGLIGPDGRIAAASDMGFPAVPIDLSDRDFVAAFPAGARAVPGFVGQAVLSRVDGRPQVHMARGRVPASAANAVAGGAAGGVGDGGVVVAGFRPSLFEDLFAQVASGRRGTMLLLRGDGRVLARFPDPVAPGNLRPLAATDPVRVAARLLSPGDSLAVDSGRLGAVQRVGEYGLLLAVTLDPAVARRAWLREMLFPTLGATATAALLLLLAHRTQARLNSEAQRMRLRTAQAEAERTAAQERARLEAKLRRTEKQAALGQLAAGVAHDFNNLLQTVMVGAEAMQRRPATPERIASSAQLILRAAERGIALTRRMLDYARVDERIDSSHRVECFAPEAALNGARELLSHLLGNDWPVLLRLPSRALPAARGDAAECEAVLLNLAVNARDAMPDGGTIVIEAALAEPPATLAQAAAGAFVRVSVHDSGCGMDAATLARAGEAFFSTKPRGAGTGLGLSMARGFAQRAGGTLEIASRAGEGTTVTLWLAAG